MNLLKSIHSETVNYKFIIDMEFYEPLDKEFNKIMKEECDGMRRYKNIKNENIISFRFIESKTQELINAVNLILKSETYAFLYQDHEHPFIDFFSMIFIKYVDVGELKW